MASAEGTGKRVALVIGNGRYKAAGSLKNPANDAAAISAALAAFGFQIVGGQQNGIDLDYGKFAERIRDFGRSLRDASVALLFYAGHGLQVAGRNYLVPVDATLEQEADVALELVELQAILNQMERPDRTSIVILDACRNNPLARNLARAMGLDGPRAAGITEGLAEQKVVAGTLIAFATQSGHVAYDGAGQNGYFTEALLEQLRRDPAREVELLLKDVRAHVVSETKTKTQGAQIPWVHSSLIGRFSFAQPKQDEPKPEKEALLPPEPAPFDPRQMEQTYWLGIKDADAPELFVEFLQKFPDGVYAPLARRKLEALRAEAHAKAEAEAKRQREAEEARHRREEKARARAERGGVPMSWKMAVGGAFLAVVLAGGGYVLRLVGGNAPAPAPVSVPVKQPAAEEMAKADDDKAFAAAQSKGTKIAFEAYLKQYSRHAEEARALLGGLDVAAYKVAESANTVQAFKDYRDDWPDGLYFARAGQRITTLETAATAPRVPGSLRVRVSSASDQSILSHVKLAVRDRMRHTELIENKDNAHATHDLRITCRTFDEPGTQCAWQRVRAITYELVDVADGAVVLRDEVRGAACLAATIADTELAATRAAANTLVDDLNTKLKREN